MHDINRIKYLYIEVNKGIVIKHTYIYIYLCSLNFSKQQKNLLLVKDFFFIFI